jgi:plasmid stabilization system protein ParE
LECGTGLKPTISKLARNDLKEIHEHLAAFGENPPIKFRASFEEFCVQVATRPYMFSRYERNQNYRKSVIAFDYLVFYQVEKNSGEVKIYRVLHGKRNVEFLLE